MSEAIELDDGEVWLNLTIGGKTFEVEVFDACDILAENDKRFRNVPAFCQDCQEAFRITDAEWGAPKATCPKCKKTTAPPQEFLDGVIEILQKKFGAGRCSRQSALRFYMLVVSKAEELKKNTETPPELPTGTE